MIVKSAIMSKILNLSKNKLNYLYINFLIIFVFSVIYWWYGSDTHFVFQPHFAVNNRMTYLSALYYTFITHTTVGFGDISPKSKLTQIITMVHLTVLTCNLSLLLF